jgi:hypothetical protein
VLEVGARGFRSEDRRGRGMTSHGQGGGVLEVGRGDLEVRVQGIRSGGVRF